MPKKWRPWSPAECKELIEGGIQSSNFTVSLLRGLKVGIQDLIFSLPGVLEWWGSSHAWHRPGPVSGLRHHLYVTTSASSFSFTYRKMYTHLGVRGNGDFSCFCLRICSIFYCYWAWGFVMDSPIDKCGSESLSSSIQIYFYLKTLFSLKNGFLFSRLSFRGGQCFDYREWQTRALNTSGLGQYFIWLYFALIFYIRISVLVLDESTGIAKFPDEKGLGPVKVASLNPRGHDSGRNSALQWWKLFKEPV